MNLKINSSNEFTIANASHVFMSAGSGGRLDLSSKINIGSILATDGDKLLRISGSSSFVDEDFLNLQNGSAGGGTRDDFFKIKYEK